MHSTPDEEMSLFKRTLLVIFILAVYSLLFLAASSLIHPYFRDSAFYAVEISLAAFVLFFFSERLLRSRPLILLVSMCAVGYLLGATSYLIKWIFLDHRAVSVEHLAQIKSSIITGDLWFTAIFTYCWVLLPLAVVSGRWMLNRLGRMSVVP
jgi:hypothetical protein